MKIKLIVRIILWNEHEKSITNKKIIKMQVPSDINKKLETDEKDLPLQFLSDINWIFYLTNLDYRFYNS